MKKIALSFLFLAISFLSYSQGTWIQTTNFPGTPRERALTTTIGDTGYLFLGTAGATRSYDTWVYDHSNNTWTQKAPFPGTWRVDAFVFYLNGDVYIGCGSDYNGSTCYNDVWKYSPSLNTWTVSTPYPAGNQNGFASYVYNNKGYVVFGRNLCSIGTTNYFYEFDPINATWTSLTPYPSGSFYRSRANVFGTKVFFINDSGAEVLVYDLINDTWNNTYPSVPSYFSGASDLSLFTAKNKLFAYYPSLIKQFHEPTGTWLKADTSYNGAYHDYPSIMVFGDTVKFLCGKIPNSNINTNDIWNYIPGCTSTILADFIHVDTTFYGATTNLHNVSVVTPSWFNYAYHWKIDTADYGWYGGDTSFVPAHFGNYLVQLIADNGFCSDTITKNIFVTPGMWSPKTTLPLEASTRSRAIVFPIGNYAYMGFGIDETGASLNDFYKYDPSNHKLAKLNDFPFGVLYAASSQVYNGKGYLLGGTDGNWPYKSNWFYEYDPTNDSWTRLTDFPGAARYGAQTFIINNFLYLCLGGTNETYKYDFTNSVWTAIAAHPQLTFANHAFSYNGKGLIMINGNTGNQLWQYDPGADSWSIYATNFLPENLVAISAILTGNKIWMGYGKLAGSTLVDFRSSTLFYDLTTGVATPGPSNFAFTNVFPQRSEATFFQLNGYTYSCFGKNPGGADRVIARFEPGACVNLPFYKPDDIDEAGIGIRISVSNTSQYYLPANPSSFEMLVDGLQDTSGINGAYSSLKFKTCGEHKYQWVMTEAACTDTFTLYLTGHPIFRIQPKAETPFGVKNIRHSVNAFSINGLGYMGMGNKYVEILSEAYKDWFEYDPLLDTWTVKSSLPTSASVTTGSACFSNLNNGFIASGSNGCFPSASCYLTNTWMYDPLADTWTAKTNMPSPGRYLSRADVLGDTAFIGMGYYPFNGGGTIYKYSLLNDTWTTANWPYGVGFIPTMFSFGGNFYSGYSAVGGAGNFYGLYEYNSANGSWSSSFLKHGELRDAFVTKVYGNDVYSFDTQFVNKIDMVKKKVIPLQPIEIPGDTSVEMSGGFSINDQVYFSLLNLDFGSPRLGNHFYLYDLASPVCNIDSFITVTPFTSSVKKHNLTIWPVPANELVTIKYDLKYEKNILVEVTDLSGRIVYSEFSNKDQFNINTLAFKNGVYIVTLKNKNNLIVDSKKMIVNR